MLRAEKHVGDEPFAVLPGDDIINNSKPCINQLAGRFSKYKLSIIALQQIPNNMISSYGIIDELFDKLKITPPGFSDEIQLADALNLPNSSQKVYACSFEGRKYDVDDKKEYVEVILDFALSHKGIGDDVMEYIQTVD